MEDRRDNSSIFERMDKDKDEANEKINLLNVNQASMSGKITNIEASTTRIEKKLDDFIYSAKSEFAPMWVKKVIVWLGITLGASILGFIGSIFYAQIIIK